MRHFWNQDGIAQLYVLHNTKHNIYKIGVTEKNIEDRLKFYNDLTIYIEDGTRLGIEWDRSDLDILYCKWLNNARQIERDIKKMIVGKTLKLRKTTFHEHFTEQSINDVLDYINKNEQILNLTK
jgi:hypothetical protein